MSDSEGEEDLILLSKVPLAGAKAAILIFNRPKARNPIDRITIGRLKALLLELIEEGEVTTIILTGQGEAFSAGGDLKGYQTLYRDPALFQTFMDDFNEVCRILETAPVLTISMINGTCVAGGLELSLACDFITMALSARIGDGHLRFAQLPGAGGSQRLTRAIGVQRAKYWLYTGRLFTAAEAQEAGLVVLCASAEDIQQQTLALAAEVAALTPLGWRTMKGLVHTAQSTLLPDGLKIEGETVFEYATSSHDATEGLRAFAERRAARYLGR